MTYKYNNAVIGGTFDKLHDGHKAFLRYAFFHAKNVFIGLTSDEYTRKHKPDVSSFTQREKDMHTFLAKENVARRTTIIPIHDVYGITLNREIQLDVIFVTKDSLHGAKEINRKRKEQDLPLLVIEEMPMVTNETGIPLSATQIRNGTCNRYGKAFT